MTAAFALDFIPRRMAELGYSPTYLTRWRQLQLDGQGVLKIDASNEFYYLIKPNLDFVVESQFGINDLTDTSIKEMQYEHRGKITITNKSNLPQLIQFIQVIPHHR
jgi:hypothetical protein